MAISASNASLAALRPPASKCMVTDLPVEISRAGQCMVGLAEGTGNPSCQLEPLIETHGFPHMRHGLTRTPAGSARPPRRLLFVPPGPCI